MAAGFGVAIYIYLTLPDVRPLRTQNPASTAWMDLRAREAQAQGKKLRHVQRWMSYNRMSPNLVRAVLVAEDDAFWDHEGIDFVQLQESIEKDLKSGRMVRGASTVTQQLAKNLYLSPTKNPIRKVQEWMIARRMEAELKKARILDIYLNVIEWGDGIWGADAAARAYFATSAASLNAPQAALLSGAIPNPRVLIPGGRPTPRLLQRQQLILKRMGGIAAPPPEPVAVPPPPSTEPARADPVEPITPEATPEVQPPTSPADNVQGTKPPTL